MTGRFVLRRLAPALLLAPALSACVATSGNPSATRATALAEVVSRAGACNAGRPRANTLERFLQAEREHGATPEQIARARSAYVAVSEAETINQSVKPQGCTAEERATLRQRMIAVRAGEFGAL
ncbi:hypothetical protein ABE438_13275 [Bosea sp. TWI1241]|uniref:hypothetical protein n=1 Tax=Bosea sp. TWI1241 TaxID=3148904 RepID=UPI0032098254